MKFPLGVKLLAFAPVTVATFACAWLADAQDAVQATPIAQSVAEVSATETVSASSVVPEEMGFEGVPAVESTLLPAWPVAGKSPELELLQYSGVNGGVQALLADKYETWLGYMDSQAESRTLPQNLLQATGCIEPCGMHKALLVVDSEERKVFVAMVEGGHVLMRPSLMSWPDAAISPLKKWLAAGDTE